MGAFDLVGASPPSTRRPDRGPVCVWDPTRENDLSRTSLLNRKAGEGASREPGASGGAMAQQMVRRSGGRLRPRCVSSSGRWHACRCDGGRGRRRGLNATAPATVGLLTASRRALEAFIRAVMLADEACHRGKDPLGARRLSGVPPAHRSFLRHHPPPVAGRPRYGFAAKAYNK